MIRNYFKTAFRNISKHLNYTLINVIGLAFGMACCFLITLYVRFELSYESFHEKKHELYRYVPRSSNKGELAMQTYTPAGLGSYFANNFHEVKSWTRVAAATDKAIIRHQAKSLAPEPFILADSAFFSMFSFNLLSGNSADVLSRPFTVAISKSIADRFFPGEDPLGKQLDYEGKLAFEITGVFADVPENSHLKFSYVGSFVSMPEIIEKLYGYRNPDLLNDMGAWNYSTYFHIPVADIGDLEKRMSVKLFEHDARGRKLPDNYVYDWLQPLTEIHFTSGIKGDSGGTGNMSYVYIFSAIAGFVLLIACFNFMNLSTALALKRAKEVGLRKAIGATRVQLVIQFVGETLMLIILAFIIGLQLVELSLPAFNTLMDLHLSLRIWSDSTLLLIVFAIGLFTALIAGAYPAFYLSSFQASRVLKGEKLGSGKSGLRKTLTIAQFAIATFMIIGTTVVFQQMQHMKNASLGFDKELVVTFPTTVEVHRDFETFKQNLLKHSGISAATLCGGVPGKTLSHWHYHFPGGEAQDRGINTIVMDYDYLDVIGVAIAQGRALSKDFATDDSLAYLINETAAKEFLLEDPVGTPFQVMDGQHSPGKIVGVVKDFHFRSLQHKVDPLVMRIEKGNAWLVAVKLAPGNIQEKLAHIEQEWKKISPDYPFDYTFLDESYDKLYKSEEKTGILMTSFSSLAIIVACLGLLGLTSFLTQQRRHEISIRKVHGASASDVVKLLSWDFLKLVVTGFVIMIPVSWYVADKWLENFAYKISLNPLVFLLSGVIIILFAVATVIYQSLKASRLNPAEVLKDH